MDEIIPGVPWWRAFRIPIILGAGGVVFVGLALFLLVKILSISEPITFTSETAVSASDSGTITVDIGGGIVHSGVYVLPYGSRVEDALKAAGGFSPNADMSLVSRTINRAAVLTDGQKIYIPVPTPTPPPGADPEPQSAPGADANHPVSVNSASIAELDGLPGIGPVTAGKIISNRPYQSVDELLSKKAVSASVFEKIKGLISL